MLPKSESVLNTDVTSVYTTFEMNWMNTFHHSGRKPRMERHMDGRTDGRPDAKNSYVPSRPLRAEDNELHQKYLDFSWNKRSHKINRCPSTIISPEKSASLIHTVPCFKPTDGIYETLTLLPTILEFNFAGHLVDLGPLLPTWFNFNPGMDK